jgi:nicotinamidase-related amidase
MVLHLLKNRRKAVLLDINTQRDFLLAGGKACIRNHRRVLSHIRRVMAWARSKDIPVVSTCEVHPNNNSPPMADVVNYCLDGTDGQKKVPYTLLRDRVSFPADGNTDLPRDMLRQHRQIILHQRCVDPFDEPRIDRLLSDVRASEFVLIGASTEGAVRAAALGLLQRSKKVIVVVDAVGSHNNREAKMALRKMQAKGARLIDTKTLAGTSHLRLVGACDCESCQGLARKAPVGAPQRN